jgi:hypothetical protein
VSMNNAWDRIHSLKDCSLNFHTSWSNLSFIFMITLFHHFASLSLSLSLSPSLSPYKEKKDWQ